MTRKRINRLREHKGLPPLPASDDELVTNEEPQIVKFKIKKKFFCTVFSIIFFSL